VGLQHALDPVERAARDREGAPREPLRLELAGSEREERRAVGGLAVQARAPGQAAERAVERREEQGVRVAEREVAQVRRGGGERPNGERRPRAFLNGVPVAVEPLSTCERVRL